VDEFLSRSGLPATLTSPYSFYTNRIYLAELVEAGAALFGARNSVSLTLFWRENEPVSASGTVLPDAFASVNRFRQRGGIVAAGHNLSGSSTLTASVQRTYTLSDDTSIGADGNDIDSTEDVLRVTLTHRLSAATLVAAGARWVDFDSNVLDSFRERAVFASLTHRF
jgi:uncharacterized protein (PEP-CTERM system associated)